MPSTPESFADIISAEYTASAERELEYTAVAAADAPWWCRSRPGGGIIREPSKSDTGWQDSREDRS